MGTKIPAVIGVAEARTRLPEILAGFTEDPDHEPVVVGAYRRPQGVIISTREYERLTELDELHRTRRAEAVALASVRAEGGEPTPEVRADMDRVAHGEMSFEEARERTLKRYRQGG